MKRIHLLLLALLALFAGAPFRAAAEDTFRDRVVIIPVGEDSLTSKQSFGFMNRILKRAQEEQARAVVFDLNTPGGLAWENQRNDDEKHPAAHHSHLRLRKPQGHVRRGAHLRGVR